MDKEIRFKCSDEMLAAVQVISDRKGLTMGQYARMVILEELSRIGVNPTQPRVD